MNQNAKITANRKQTCFASIAGQAVWQAKPQMTAMEMFKAQSFFLNALSVFIA